MNIKLIASVLTLAPKIVATVRELEMIEQTSGKGAAKKALALTILQAAYTATKPELPFDEIAAVVGSIIDAAVKFYNDIGAFIKK